MSAILVVGEALVDIVETSGGDRAEHPGGSPANVALGLARLGRSVDLLTWLAEDALGRTVVDHLTASGVDVLPGSLGAARTSTALARLDETGAATYEFDLEWQLAPTTPRPDLGVLHTGSIAAVAPTVPPGALLRLVRETRGTATITYDPNLRPSIMGPVERVRADVEELVDVADVVKVSDEDLAWLHPGADPLDVARDWVDDAGCALVVVTRGGRGSVGLTAHGGQVDVAVPAVTVVDTVGAGDAFMSGLIAALHEHAVTGAERRHELGSLSEATLRAVLDHAARVAAVTVGRAGANPPTLAELAVAG